MHDCLIAFGSNEGNSIEVFEQAVKRISELADVSLLASSKPLQTQPVGGPAGQDAYLNAVIRIETNLDPKDLHRELVEIETEFGRERRERWGSRKIDLDLLLCGLMQLETQRLTLPHPRMSFRRFVIEPANEIASDMVHVTSGQTIAQLLKSLDHRKDLLLLVSQPSQFGELEELIQKLLPSGWTFETVSNQESLDRFRNQAKLVCFVGGGPDQTGLSEPNPLVRSAFSFPGPTLRLDRDLAKSKMEIIAAFEAIKPLS